MQQHAQRGMRSTVTGFFVNVLLAGTKLVAGFVGNSYALVADGIESTTDLASSIIIWSGLKIGSEPPDDSHPYGHGRAEAIAAAIVSLLLIAAAIGMATAAAEEIRTPHDIPAPFTLAVLIIVVIVKESMFRFVNGVGNDIGSHAVKTDAWHHRSDAITSAAAFIGILISLVGGPGWESADDWAALFACGIIAWNGIRLLLPALHELMDRVYEGPEKQQMIDIALSISDVRAIEKIRVRKLGMHFHVDVHVQADGMLTLDEAHVISGKVKTAFREQMPSILNASIHMEPFEDDRTSQLP